MKTIRELETNNDGLIFDETNHKYFLDGKELKSTTRLLADQHLSPSYDGVDEETLKKAVAYGNQVHKEIEDYLKNGELGNSFELTNFISWLKTNPFCGSSNSK